MPLYKSIARRKSCRKYDMQDLGNDFLQEVDRAVEGFDRLYSDINLSHRFTKKVQGSFHIEAPHYLIIEGEGKPREMEEAGFLYQQLCLWFDSKGIGCVWLGESKDSILGKQEGDIIAIGFGKTLDSPHRSEEDFKRKPLEKITNDPADSCMKAVNLAPSGVNIQPWYFKKQADKVLVYKRKLIPPVSLIYKLVDIDMGIALCHYALACKNEGKDFYFKRTEDLEKKTNYTPFGIIESSQ